MPPLPLPPTPQSLQSLLTHDRNILHLLVYKSKNQHRSSLWFKWLQMLKRSLERITLHLQTKYQDNNNSTLEGNKREEDQEGEDEDEDDLEESRNNLIIILKSDKTFTSLLYRLTTAIIPNAHRAFTLLLTSTQYAAMGMVMLGCLARVHEILKPFSSESEDEEYQDIKTKESEDTTTLVANTFEEDTGEVINRDSIIVPKHQRTRKAEEEEQESEDSDSGVIVKRQRVEIRSKRISTSPLMADEGIITTESKKRTAIDDLFAGL